MIAQSIFPCFAMGTIISMAGFIVVFKVKELLILVYCPKMNGCLFFPRC